MGARWATIGRSRIGLLLASKLIFKGSLAGAAIGTQVGWQIPHRTEDRAQLDRFVDALDTLLLRIFSFMARAASRIAAEISNQLPGISASA